MTHLRRSFVVPSLATLAVLVACGGGGGSDEGGTTSSAETTESPTDATGSPTTNATMTTTVDSTGPADSEGSSTTDPDGGSTDTGTTGVAECPYTPVDGNPPLALELVGTGFNRPLLALGHPDQPDRLFVVEQGGDVRILEPGTMQAPESAFLHVDVSGAGNGTIGDERGLLGFAFHPDFPNTPLVYVAYNAAGEQSPPVTVSEFELMAGDPDQVDPASERVVIAYDKPAPNHNGGMIGFGPNDGLLYIATGDGGFGDDAYGTGRDLGVILAKVLRIDPTPDGTEDNPISCLGQCNMTGPFDYTIPADNPFVGDADAAPEVWAWGMRNPWRFAWDLDNGDMYLADVGQEDWEEVNLVSAGRDYGWSNMEGNHCFAGGCDENAGPNQENADGITAPLVDYSSGTGSGNCTVVGGGVYRSCEVPMWSGVYVYGDYCSGSVGGLTWDGASVSDLGVVLDIQGEALLGNGWNAWGDVYLTTNDSAPNGPVADGRVYRLAPQ